VDVHPVEEFWADLATLPAEAYPVGTVPVRHHIRGTAFFSGGAGLYIEDPAAALPPFPFGGVMVVGHNLDAEAPFLERVRSGRAHGDRRWPMRTWRNLYKLLDGAGVQPSTCFFTNVYVGLIAGSKPVGAYPGARDRDFTSWCDGFLRRQIARMRPRAIVSLGGASARYFGWQGHEPRAVTVDGLAVRAVPLAHPSMHPANVRTRGGVDAEIERLRATAFAET
jgi:hypothetical protein